MGPTAASTAVSARGPASVAIRRLVEWSDTDAAARYHHSTVIRWVEAAEAELLRALDLLDVFGFVPRVRYEVDYLGPLFFRDEIELVLTVESVGGASIRYGFDVRRTRLAEDVDYGTAAVPADSSVGDEGKVSVASRGDGEGATEITVAQQGFAWRATQTAGGASGVRTGEPAGEVSESVLVARGAMVAVLIEGDNGGPRRWPDRARRRLLTSGRQLPYAV